MRIDGPQVTSSLSLNGTTITDLNVFVTTGSLNGITGSYATTGSNLFKGDQTLSGSFIPAVNNTYDLGSPTNQFRHVYISSGSLYVNGTKVLGSTSQELQITTDTGQSFKILESGADTITLQSADGNVTLTSTGQGDIVMDPNTGVIGLKGTVTIYTGNKIVSSDGNAIQFGNGIAITGSIVATGTNLISGSSQVLNGSGVWSGSAQLPSGIVSGSAQLPNGIVSSSSQVTGYGFATTGSNNFQGTQTITGSLFISQNLVVQGSSSLENITASVVNIGSNLVNLNTSTPAIRFAGLNVFDSGSIGGSGSFLYDSVQDEFIFVHRGDNVNITSSVVMMGPQTYNNVGSEIYPTTNRILKGLGNEHVGDSIISETNGGIGISGSLSITGSIVATGTSLWSGSAQLPLGIVSGSSQVISLLPSGAVSGSVQVDVMSTTNIARLATTGSNTFTGNIRVPGLSIGVAPTSNVLDIRGENNTYDGTIIIGARGTIQHRDAGQTILSIANDYNDNAAKFEIRMKGNTTGDAKLTILGSGASTFSNTLQANGKIFLQRASTGADTLLQFKNEVGVDKAYIKFGGVNEEISFHSGTGSNRNLIIDADGSMGFNTPTFGVRSFLFKALSGRQLAIEALESGGVHSIYLRPSSSGRNLIASNYFSGGVYLPLALSGRENDTDLVLHANGNISMGSATDGGVRLSITGANSGEGQLYVGNTDVTYSAGVNFTTSGTNRGFVGWRHTNSGAPFTLTGIHLFNTDNSNIVFGTNNTVKAVINVDGNLGINDNNPGTRLSVNGANYVEMATFACTTTGAATMVSDNTAYVQFSNGNARHISNTSVFTAVTDGIRILKAGMVHVTFSQDITTAGTTGYVAGYIEKNKSAISENLITNTGGQWDGINGCTTVSVAANDVINFKFTAADILSFDPNTWSNYSFIWTSR
jgi:hypothetical protein